MSQLLLHDRLHPSTSWKSVCVPICLSRQLYSDSGFRSSGDSAHASPSGTASCLRLHFFVLLLLSTNVVVSCRVVSCFVCDVYCELDIDYSRQIRKAKSKTRTCVSCSSRTAVLALTYLRHIDTAVLVTAVASSLTRALYAL